MEEVHFRIIEGDPEDYWDNYEEFIKLYNANNSPVKTIQEKLELSNAQYRNYRNKALEENRLKNTRKRIFKNKFGKYSKPKYYYRLGNRFSVAKNINGKLIHFGCYENEKLASLIVEKLIEVRWDKKQLRRIQKEVANHG